MPSNLAQLLLTFWEAGRLCKVRPLNNVLLDKQLGIFQHSSACQGIATTPWRMPTVCAQMDISYLMALVATAWGWNTANHVSGCMLTCKVRLRMPLKYPQTPKISVLFKTFDEPFWSSWIKWLLFAPATQVGFENEFGRPIYLKIHEANGYFLFVPTARLQRSVKREIVVLLGGWGVGHHRLTPCGWAALVPTLQRA